MKKTVITLFFLLVLFVGMFERYKTKRSHDRSGMDEWEEAVYLKDEVDCKTYVYGEEILFPSQFEYEKLLTLDFTKLNFNHDTVYLVINELNATDYLDENKINELYELANNRSNFNFIYLGTHALPVFTAIIPNCNFDDSDLSFSYVMEESGRTKVFGVFSREYIPYAEKNKMLIADNIIHFIYLNVKRLN